MRAIPLTKRRSQHSVSVPTSSWYVFLLFCNFNFFSLLQRSRKQFLFFQKSHVPFPFPSHTCSTLLFPTTPSLLPQLWNPTTSITCVTLITFVNALSLLFTHLHLRHTFPAICHHLESNHFLPPSSFAPTLSHTIPWRWIHHLYHSLTNLIKENLEKLTTTLTLMALTSNAASPLLECQRTGSMIVRCLKRHTKKC